MRSRELEQFEKALLKQKEQIIKNLQSVESELRSYNECELKDEGDLASASSEGLIDEAISNQQLQELKEIEYALTKIKNKTYGICEMCEEKISFERLKVKLHAKYCIDCREIVEKNGMLANKQN